MRGTPLPPPVRCGWCQVGVVRLGQVGARLPVPLADEEQHRRPPTCNPIGRDSGPVRAHHGRGGHDGVEVAVAPLSPRSAVTVAVQTVRAPAGSPPPQRNFLCPARARAAVQAVRS